MVYPSYIEKKLHLRAQIQKEINVELEQMVSPEFRKDEKRKLTENSVSSDSQNQQMLDVQFKYQPIRRNSNVL